MFREFRQLQLRKPQRVKSVEPSAPPAPPDPFSQAVSIVRSSGLDPDEVAATLRRLRNFWLMKRLEKLGFEIFG